MAEEKKKFIGKKKKLVEEMKKLLKLNGRT